MPGPQIGILANKNGRSIQPIYHLHSGQFGFFQMQLHALWAVQCASHISEADAKLSQQIKPHLLPYLPRQHNHFLADSGRTSAQVVCSLKLKPSKCALFKEEINYLVHQVSKEGVQPSDLDLRAITECAPPQTYTEI